MENVLNVTNDGLVEDETLRNMVLEDIPDIILRESYIWRSLKTEFVEFIPGIMDMKGVINFYDTVKQSILEHTDKDEIQEAGAQRLTHKQWKKLLETLNSRLNLTLSNSNEFSDFELKLLEILATMTQEERESINFPPNGTWLFSLEAVCKLGMMMTRTEKAKEFRDRLIDTLKIEVAKTEDIKNVNETSINVLNDMIDRKEVPTLEVLRDFLKASMESAKKISFTYYKEMNIKLKLIKVKLEELLTELKSEDTTNMTRLEKAIHTENIDRCKLVVQLISDEIIDNDDVIREIQNKTMRSIGTELDTNLTAMLEEKLNKKVSPKTVKEYKDKLVELGILETTHPVAKRNSYDKDGNLVRSIGEENEDITLYVPTESFKWFNTGKYANISLTAAAQRFDLSECGKEFILKALFEDTIYETEDDFIDYLLNKY